MAEKPEKSSSQRVIDYYNTRESRWGYQLMLGGTKHFGYYPTGRDRISMRRAMGYMEFQLGQSLGLPPGSRVLDAGCGMGRVAVHLAETFGYQVDGLDLLDFNIAAAKKYAAKQSAADRTSFQIGDYNHLPYPDATFDAVYTMETLYHAPDYDHVLSELRRVLRPGGRLVLFEYSLADPATIPPKIHQLFETAANHSAMHPFPPFQHDGFKTLLETNGFSVAYERDITAHVVPMLRRFYQFAVLPYYLDSWIKRDPANYVNVIAGYAGYKYRRYWRYNIIVATSQSPSAASS